MKKILASVLFLFILASVASCGQTPETGTVSSVSSISSTSSVSSAEDLLMKDYLNSTAYPQDYWPVSTPEAQGISSSKLMSVLSNFYTRNQKIQSFLVIRNGVLVFERYGTDPSDVWNTDQDREMTASDVMTPDFRHHWYSTTKSVVSALTGIALDQQFLTNVDQIVVDFCDDVMITNSDPRVSNITIEHILCMTGGFSWNDSNEYSSFASANLLSIVMNRSLTGDPGAVWNYNSGSPSLLTHIIEKATDTNVLDFASRYLFEPIGISSNSYTWNQDPSGLNYGGFGIWMNSRNMAKFGYLFLKKGMFGTNRVISEAWVSNSTATHVTGAWGPYGYLWWPVGSGSIYASHGLKGQNVFIVPDKNLVVVFTANLNPDQADSILTSYVTTEIIPALTN